MATGKLNPQLAEELARLALLPDDQIDTSDIPVVTDWSRAERGRYWKTQLQARDYDVRAIANWFIRRASDEGRRYSNLSLNKIVYFTLENSLAERLVDFTPAKVEAWQYGPVFRELYHAAKKYGDEPIDDLFRKFSVELRDFVIADDVFAQSDLEFLEDIYDRFGRRSATELVRLSHRKGTPWYFVWNLHGKTHPGMEIQRELILQILRGLHKVNEGR
jgi:uncharacterized phage-associated protein